MTTPDMLIGLLRSLEFELLQTATRHNTHRVDALLCDDWYEFGASGRVWTKATTLEALAEEPPVERTMSDFRLTPLGPDAALVTYRVHRHEPDGDVKSLRSSLWVREGEAWRMKFHQGTLTP